MITSPKLRSLVLMGFTAYTAVAVAQQKPNIVLILADEMGFSNVWLNGNTNPRRNALRIGRKNMELDGCLNAGSERPLLKLIEIKNNKAGLIKAVRLTKI